MGQVVHTFPKETIQQMKQYYKNTSEHNPPGALFRARTEYAVITAYKSGKVLFQGNSPEIEAGKWDNSAHSNQLTPKRQQTKQKTIESRLPPEELASLSHIGSDESGTGDYFGPVTTCALYVSNDQIAYLKQLGIQDSKAISDSDIHILSKELINIGVPYSLLVLHNEKYNVLQREGWSQGKMKAMLHHHAITNVLLKTKGNQFDGILIDQFCTPDLYIRYIASENESLTDKTYFMTKAESYSIAVAAASVIARSSFLNEMDKLSEQIGHTLLKGASKHVDRLIATIIQEQGESALKTCAKLHFANTEKAKRLI